MPRTKLRFSATRCAIRRELWAIFAATLSIRVHHFLRRVLTAEFCVLAGHPVVGSLGASRVQALVTGLADKLHHSFPRMSSAERGRRAASFSEGGFQGAAWLITPVFQQIHHLRFRVSRAEHRFSGAHLPVRRRYGAVNPEAPPAFEVNHVFFRMSCTELRSFPAEHSVKGNRQAVLLLAPLALDGDHPLVCVYGTKQRLVACTTGNTIRGPLRAFRVLTIAVHIHHSFPRVRCAKLGQFRTGNPAPRMLLAAGVAAPPFVANIDHPFRVVSEAVKGCASPGLAVRWLLCAAFVPTLLVGDSHHTRLRVLNAVFREFRPAHTVAGSLGAAWVETSPVADVYSFVRLMCRAEKSLLSAENAIRWLFGAP